ncbi:formyltransferase family protein [Desulfobacter latus]|uniref:Methionyl-tRNA formyltransferase n=1 Tax=Desulfobacter latus TaxID=2292 RepID=A0A850T9U0_9BACT|nr:formyltransferase family protein [Desulfobacter latus]NWH04977.1 methionyl-tRNA formyltransferase [Desulfobacter latus]
MAELLRPVHNVAVCYCRSEIQSGSFLFMLGCTKILPPEYLDLNKHNIVIHESDLPRGRGWSPVSWQVLEGKNKIPVSLFEAGRDMDSGDIYLKDEIILEGGELLPEIKKKQGIKTIEMIIEFIDKWPNLVAVPQRGEATLYRKRTIRDDRLDIDKPLKHLFNQLRIVDNEKYPAWFEINGMQYQLKIYPDLRTDQKGEVKK